MCRGSSGETRAGGSAAIPCASGSIAPTLCVVESSQAVDHRFAALGPVGVQSTSRATRELSRRAWRVGRAGDHRQSAPRSGGGEQGIGGHVRAVPGEAEGCGSCTWRARVGEATVGDGLAVPSLLSPTGS
jgi:hypothetical protein